MFILTAETGPSPGNPRFYWRMSLAVVPDAVPSA